MLQAWLYFGLLQELFGVQLTVSGFLSRNSQGLTLDSTKLPLYIDLRRTRLRMHRSVLGEDRDDLEGLVDFVEEHCYHLETEIDDPRMRISPCPEILLSIHILTQTLRASASLPAETSSPGYAADLALLLPLRTLCTPQKGWCTPSFNHLCEKFDHSTLYYLVCLRRRRISNH